jgi:hypothetical protein
MIFYQDFFALIYIFFAWPIFLNLYSNCLIPPNKTQKKWEDKSKFNDEIYT